MSWYNTVLCNIAILTATYTSSFQYSNIVIHIICNTVQGFTFAAVVTKFVFVIELHDYDESRSFVRAHVGCFSSVGALSIQFSKLRVGSLSRKQ